MPRLSRGASLTLAVVMVAVLAAATGCAGAGKATGSDGTNQRYISGTGEVDAIPQPDRVSAPVLRGETLDGRALSTASWRGKVIVVNFWASWCPPCRAEAEALQAVYEKTKADGVQFVGVNIKDNRTNAKLYEKEFGITYPSFYDPRGELALAFRGQLPPAALPSTIVIDRQGKVAVRIIGQTTYTKLLRVVRQTAQE